MDTKDSLNAKGMSRQLGKSGTQIYGGIITGEEYNKRLTGAQALKQFDIMRRSDATVHSALLVCMLPIEQADWRVEAASEDEQDKFIARHIENELMHKNVNFTSFLREAMGMLWAGFSVAEMSIELTEFEKKTVFGLAALEFRKQTSIYKWETQDAQEGITQQLISGLVSIPREKLIVFTHDREGDNFEGISMLRYAYKDWDMKDKLGLVLAIALEKAGVPTPVITVPNENISPKEKEELLQNIQELRSNERGYIQKPKGWEIDVLDMSGQTTKDILPTIRYHDRQIVRSILAQFLELGAQDTGGSRALSSDQSSLFEKSLEALAKTLRDTIQKELINKLCDLSFSKLPNGYPKLQFGKFSQDDIAAKATAVSELVKAGVIQPNFDTENTMRKVAGLPELPEDLRKDYVVPTPAPATNIQTTPPAKDVKASIRKAKLARNELIDILVRD